jgi:hypothetical protein
LAFSLPSLSTLRLLAGFPTHAGVFSSPVVLCYMPFLLPRFLSCCLLFDSCYWIARLACATLSALTLRYIPGLPLIVPSRITLAFLLYPLVSVSSVLVSIPCARHPPTLIHTSTSSVIAYCLLLATYPIYLLCPYLSHPNETHSLTSPIVFTHRTRSLAFHCHHSPFPFLLQISPFCSSSLLFLDSNSHTLGHTTLFVCYLSIHRFIYGEKRKNTYLKIKRRVWTDG